MIEAREHIGFHLAFPVKDLESTVAFYGGLLGLPAIPGLTTGAGQ